MLSSSSSSSSSKSGGDDDNSEAEEDNVLLQLQRVMAALQVGTVDEYTRTHTRTRAYVHTRAHVHSRTRAHMHALSKPCTQESEKRFYDPTPFVKSMRDFGGGAINVREQKVTSPHLHYRKNQTDVRIQHCM